MARDANGDALCDTTSRHLSTRCVRLLLPNHRYHRLHCLPRRRLCRKSWLPDIHTEIMVILLAIMATFVVCIMCFFAISPFTRNAVLSKRRVDALDRDSHVP